MGQILLTFSVEESCYRHGARDDSGVETSIDSLIYTIQNYFVSHFFCDSWDENE